MSLRITLISMILIMISFLCAESIPDWVKKRPVKEGYYIGIGMSMKSSKNRDYLQIAQDNALKDLSSGIQVTVNSEVLSEVMEKSGIVKEEIESQIRTSTQAQLTGYELIDTYESKTEYWVYYDLSKPVYVRQMLDIRQKAMNLALDFYTKAKNSEKDGDITQAIRYYYQAIRPIEDYFGESLQTEYEGKSIYLGNEIYSSLQNTISKIQLAVDKKSWAAKIGLAVSPSPAVIARFLSKDNKIVYIQNLPLISILNKGELDFIPNSITDEKGIAQIRINKVRTEDNVQILKTAIDMPKLINADSSSVIFKAILKTMPVPEQMVYLSVSPLIICIQTNESMFDKPLAMPIIEPKVKETLAARGYHFSNSIKDADYIIKITANTREGSAIHPTPTNTMYIAFVDVNISLVSLAADAEIYKNALSNVKGINLDVPKAGIKAYENALEHVKDSILPELLEKLKN